MIDQSKNSLMGRLKAAQADEDFRIWLGKTGFSSFCASRLGPYEKAYYRAISRPSPFAGAARQTAGNFEPRYVAHHAACDFSDHFTANTSHLSNNEPSDQWHKKPESSFQSTRVQEGWHTRTGFSCGIISGLAFGWLVIAFVAVQAPSSELKEGQSLRKFKFAQTWPSTNQQTVVQPFEFVKYQEVNEATVIAVASEKVDVMPTETVYQDKANVNEPVEITSDVNEVLQSGIMLSGMIDGDAPQIDYKHTPKQAQKTKPDQTSGKVQKENTKENAEPILIVAKVVQPPKPQPAKEKIEPFVIISATSADKTEPKDNNAQKTKLQTVVSKVEQRQEQENKDRDKQSTSLQNRIADNSSLPPIPSRGVRLASDQIKKPSTKRSRRTSVKRRITTARQTSKARSWSKSVKSRQIKNKKFALGAKQSNAKPKNKFGFEIRSEWERRAFQGNN